MAKQPKLKALLEDIFQEQPQVNKYKVVEGVRSYGVVGKQLYNNGNIMEMAKQLSEIAEHAHSHVLGETDDWFDQVSVNKNMKTLKTNVAEFKKTAFEAHQLNQRLTGLYEDIGHVLNRYYEIDEVMEDEIREQSDSSEIGKANNKVDVADGSDEEDPEAIKEDKGDMDNDGKDEPDDEEYFQNKDKAIKKAMKNEDKGDMDNDGKDEPDDEEYFQNKDKAIKKAIKKENRSLKDIGGVVGIPALGQIARKFLGKK